MTDPPGNAYHNIQISGNARVLLGNASGQATESTLATHADYTGQYANSSLRPVPSYVPRPRLHQKIKEQLHDFKDAREDDARVLVVYGLGGAGKSQLVLHYIRHYRRDYNGVFWIEAGSKETIRRDYVQICGLLYGRQTDANQGMVKVEDAVPAVKRWFQDREGRWLVVLDSADTIDDEQDESYIDLRYFMPDAPGVHVIVTSRNSTVQDMTQLEAVEVDEMEPSEATELFLRMAKLGEITLETREEIGRIVKELGHLALAITLAGSYVSATPRLKLDIKGYLPEYRQRRKELLQRRPKEFIHQYRESVLGTWEVSFEAIVNQNPAAARLLSLLAFVNFEDIFIDLFGKHYDGTVPEDQEGPLLGPGTPKPNGQTWRSFLSAGRAWTNYNVESCFEALQNYCLLQWKADQGSYAIHKLVHAWAYDRLGSDEQRELSGLSLELINEAMAQRKIGPSHRLRLVPHAMASFGAFSHLYKSLDDITQHTLEVIDSIRWFLYDMSRYSEVRKIQLFHLGKAEIILGREHPDTLRSLHDLGAVLSIQGKFRKAEEILRQVLALQEVVLGKEHGSTLLTMSHLARTLLDQGKYEEAEQKYRQSLASEKVVSSTKHRDFDAMSGLGSVLVLQGKYEKAEKLNRKALALAETELGKEHPDTLGLMVDLGFGLIHCGKYEEAEDLNRKALALSETIHAKDHSETLAIMNNLGLALQMAGKFEEGEELYRRTLALKQTVLGEKHPSTLRTMYNLALNLKDQHEDTEAFSLMKRCFQLQKEVFGSEHPGTQACARFLDKWGEDRDTSLTS